MFCCHCPEYVLKIIYSLMNTNSLNPTIQCVCVCMEGGGGVLVLFGQFWFVQSQGIWPETVWIFPTWVLVSLALVEFKLTWTCATLSWYPTISSLQDMRLAMITKSAEGHSTLMIQSLPSFENIYNLQLNAPCFISECLPLQVNIHCISCKVCVLFGLVYQ